MFETFAVIQIIICLLLVVVILLQEGKKEWEPFSAVPAVPFSEQEEPVIY